jgi:N-acetylmuramoyl-L-alanine amidase
VQLSKQHTAYIDKKSVKPDSGTIIKPLYYTGSANIKSTERGYDAVSLFVDEKLPYKSWMEVSPSRIMLEVYGVQHNTNWVTQLQSAKEVKQVYLSQPEDDVMRITIELQHQYHWGYSVFYRGRSLVVRVRQQPQQLDITQLRIAIDAGHGGSNTGATGINTGVTEKELTLQLAKTLQQYLEKKKVQVIMTRTTDTTLDMRDRILFLQQQQPHLLISLHMNAAANASVCGSSTYYRHIGYKPLTVNILKQMLQLGMGEYGNVGNFNFALSGPTDYPNCLLEVGFISNATDEGMLINPVFRQKIAEKVYEGIKDFLKEAAK